MTNPNDTRFPGDPHGLDRDKDGAPRESLR